MHIYHFYVHGILLKIISTDWVLILVNTIFILADTAAKTVRHAPHGTNGTNLVNHNGAKSP